MTCDELRPLIPLAVYGDLAGLDAERLAAHLGDCPACRAEAESLRRTRAALDAVPPPEITVAPADVLRSESARQARGLRRWKRLATAAAALAAGLLVVLLVRPDVRVGDGALVVRWKPADPPPAATVVHVHPPASNPDQTERLVVLAGLVRALADEAEGRDRDRRAEIAALQARFDALAVRENARWQDIQRDMGVLYRAQFARKEGTE
jgi:Putative zinc-finger